MYRDIIDNAHGATQLEVAPSYSSYDTDLNGLFKIPIGLLVKPTEDQNSALQKTVNVDDKPEAVFV